MVVEVDLARISTFIAGVYIYFKQHHNIPFINLTAWSGCKCLAVTTSIGLHFCMIVHEVFFEDLQIYYRK